MHGGERQKSQLPLHLHLSFRHKADTHHCLFTAVEEHIAEVSNLPHLAMGQTLQAAQPSRQDDCTATDFNLKVHIVLNPRLCSQLLFPASSCLAYCLRGVTPGKDVQG